LITRDFNFELGDVADNSDTSTAVATAATGTIEDYAAYRTAHTVSGVDPKFDYAKVVIASNGDVKYIGAYNFDNTFVVKEVSSSNKTIVGVKGTDSISSADDYLVVKDGKEVKYTDLVAGDVVFYDAAAYNGNGYAVVYNQTVTGAIDNVYH